jgi:ribosome-associated toxin RatA of RatAB toxin-antitoxin module
MHTITADAVTKRISAPAETLYSLVSDVTRTPEWSPEVVECQWDTTDAGPHVGARFTATNRRRWLRWRNHPVVDQADPPREFSVTRTEKGAGTLRWVYRLEPIGDAQTDVTLAYEVLTPVTTAFLVILRLLFGVTDLEADLHGNLCSSLDRIAVIAEAEMAGSPADPPNHGRSA